MSVKGGGDEITSITSAGETIYHNSNTIDIPYAQPLSEKVRSSSKPQCSMIYVETIKERQTRLGSGKGIQDRIKDILENAYWVYYVHLPFYLMTSFDAFCLHSFFLTIFSFSIFGILKYCFL